MQYSEQGAAAALKRHGIDYVATKKGKFTTQCPNCSTGYCNVEEKPDGVVWFCHGCSQGGGEKYEQRDHGGGLGPIKASFDYTDEKGNRLFQVLRFEPPNRPKTFRQRTGPDQEKWSIKGVRRVLYRLPELLEDIAAEHVIFVVEGEKDANALRARGVPATTNPMGATTEEKQTEGSGWLASYSETLRDVDVVICGDNDAPGREHIRIVASNLHGVAKSVRVLDLKQFWPEIEESDDISDWFDAGHTRPDLDALIEQAPDYEPEAEAAQNTEVGMPADNLCATTFEPQRFVVPGYVIEGLTLFAGKPKVGKSWLMLHAALSVALGDSTLGMKCEEGDVLYCGLEDNKRRLQGRLKKLLDGRAAPNRLRLLSAGEMPRLSEGGLDLLRTWIKQRKNPRLIVIDVLAKVRDPRKKDEGLYEGDYRAMQGLKALADEFGISIVVIHHLRKMDAEDPLDQISGTTGLTGGVDTVLVLYRAAVGVTLAGRGRDVEDINNAVLFDKDACTWTVLGEASEVQHSAGRGAILTALLGATAPMTASEISDVIGMSKANTQRLLARMANARELHRAGRGRYVHPERPDLLPVDNVVPLHPTKREEEEGEEK